jgi:hypothetical protein
MAKRRRPTRAQRRRAERERINAEARERGAAAAGEIPVQHRSARHLHVLDKLARDGVLGGTQVRAAYQLVRDHGAGGVATRLVRSLHEPGPTPPKKHQAPHPSTPAEEAARARFEAALQATAEFAPIIVHVALCDLAPGEWRPGIGANGHGHALEQLRQGLDALCRHYSAQRAAATGLAPDPKGAAATQAAV